MRQHRQPANALRFKRRLLRWFRAQGRDLPWRRSRDPYEVLVSEFMLQQTQVTRVREYYSQFLKRFPTVRHLAASSPGAVREAWDGLGYYRRASNLHQLAKTIVESHDGSIPSEPAVLEALPGVGRYTAGAVASFAYERRVPAVDTNVARVLRRVFLTPAADGAAGPLQIWNLARRLLPSRRQTAWDFNQAMMDLGSLYCTAWRPRCASCPVRPACHTGSRRGSRA